MTELPRRGPITHSEYGRAPYVRALCPDGATRDGQAHGWTNNEVLFHSQQGGTVYNAWIPTEHVQRIKRSESAWQDVYDDYDWYAEHDEL